MTRLPRPARYLLRVDDLCPTVHRERWQQLRDLIRQNGIHPILAVVPDNRDPELEVSAADPHFWTQMQELEAAGAVVALHGYRHGCIQRGKSMIPLHRYSEFAGVAFDRQCGWIAAGVAILHNHGLRPRAWVAPRHGFDRDTLRALRLAGIDCLSDGLSRVPVHRGGILWIPQQLWRPEIKAEGLWTICVHPNTMTAQDAEMLRAFVRERAGQFTSLDRTIREYAESAPSLLERGREAFMTVRMILRTMKTQRAESCETRASGAADPARGELPFA